MEICKAPTLRLKALNMHSITHIMYIKMEMLSAIKEIQKNTEELIHNVDKGSSVTMQKMHTHTHTLYRLIGVKGQCSTTEIF